MVNHIERSNYFTVFIRYFVKDGFHFVTLFVCCAAKVNQLRNISNFITQPHIVYHFQFGFFSFFVISLTLAR